MVKKQENINVSNIIYGIGLLSYSFISLFFLIIINRINGGNYGGVFTHAFSVACLLFILMTYYNRAYQLADYNDDKRFSDYFSFRLVFSLISFFFSLLILTLLNISFEEKIIFILLISYKIIDSFSDCMYGEMHRINHLKEVGISYFLKSFIGILLFLVVDIFLKNVVVSILVFLIVNILLLIVYDWSFLKKNTDIVLHFSFSKFKNVLLSSFPIFAFSFLIIFLANLQKYIMPLFYKEDLVNILGILIMPATMLSIVGNYIISPYMNSLISLESKQKYSDFFKLVWKIILYILLIGLLVAVISYTIGIPFLNFIYNIRLDNYFMAFMIIIIASIINAIVGILSNVLVIMNVNKEQLLVYLFASIVGVIVNYIFIKLYSINGAAYGYFVSYLVLLILYSCLIKIIVNRKYKRNTE